MRPLVALGLALLWVSALDAQETREAVPGAQPPAAKVADLAWLAGTWEGEGISGGAREVYFPPAAGQIAGHFTQMRGDAVWFYEILSIAEVGGSLEYRLKHFNADLTGWEEKAEVQRFPLVAVTGTTWYFDGLTLRRDGPNRMVAAVRVETKDGKPKEYVFRYTRRK
jgi:hypothetical protein